MKKTYLALGLILASVSAPSFADWHLNTDNGEWQDCGPAHVDAVRVEHGAIFALLNNQKDGWKAWKRMALNTTNTLYMTESYPQGESLRSMPSQSKFYDGKTNLRFNTEMQSSQFQSVLENALLNDKTVTVRFPGTEVCGRDNWASNAVMVQLNR